MRARADAGKAESATAWITVFVLLLVAVFAYMDRQIIALLVGPIKRTYGASDFEVGLLQGVAFGMFFALFGLPIGSLVDRYPRRLIIYLGMTIWSVATAACGLAGTFTHLLVARFAVGIGEASLSPAAYSMIADRFPPGRLAFAIGVFAAGSSIGGALAFMAGGALIGHLERAGTVVLPVVGGLAPWQLVFLITGLPGLLVALLLFTIPEPERRHRTKQTAGWGGMIAYICAHPRYFACHFFGFGLVAILAYGAAAWVPTMVMRTYHVDIAHTGLLMGAIAMATGVPGFLFSGWISDRLFQSGRRDAPFLYFAVACSISVLLALVAFTLSTTLWLTLACYAALHFLQPFTGPAVAHLQLATPDEYHGRMSALFVLIFNLMGLCLGPPSVAFVTDFLFHDPAYLRSSLAVMYVSISGLAAVVFLIGLAPARRIIATRIPS